MIMVKRRGFSRSFCRFQGRVQNAFEREKNGERREEQAMRDVQPPIANDEQYHGYQLALEKLTKVLEAREQVLFENRDNPDRIEAARGDLLNTLRKRQGILDAIHEYERRRQ